jgi:site-specific DNA recombinase
MKNIETVALIYTRVSTHQQETDGTGNKSQEIRCREMADREKIPIEKVFTDTFTGAGDFMKRPAMRELLAYIDNHPYKQFIVIFDDLKRLSRDTKAYLELRLAFKSRNVILKCLNFNFEDSPEGEFVETIIAASGELERKQNKRQVTQKQRARLLDGYYPFRALYGYTQNKKVGHGKLSEINESGKYIKEALENFSNGIFKTPTDVGKFLKEKNVIVANDKKRQWEVGLSLLRNIFYAGYIEYPEWEVPRRLGKHEAIISLKTYTTNQSILDGQIKRNRVYKRYREEFELRGLAKCIYCNERLNSYNSAKKKNPDKLTPYYECKNKECEVYRKTLRPHDVHCKFYCILQLITPTDEAVILSNEAFEEAFAEFSNRIKKESGFEQSKLKELNNQIDALLNLITNTSNSSLQKVYSEKIENLSIEKDILTQNTKNPVNLEIIKRTSVEKLFEIVKSPYELWLKLDIRQKKEFYKFIFLEDFAIGKNYEIRTPVCSPIYQYLQGFSGKFAEKSLQNPSMWRRGESNPCANSNEVNFYNV